jgi:hypothetical protein
MDRSRAEGDSKPARTLLLLALIDLPIEVILAAGSGRLYLQYLTPWLPAVAILTAAFVRFRMPLGLGVRLRRWGPAMLGLGLAAASLLTAAKVDSRQAESTQIRAAVEAVRQRSEGQSTILVWGAETQVLAMTGRQSPGRYAYLYPLLTVGYATSERVAEFADDLRSQPPALILDTSATNPVIPPLDPRRHASWTSPDSQYAESADLRSVEDWIRSNYAWSESIGAWDLYTPVQP